MTKQIRVATGVTGLDEMLSGGLVPGSTVLVRGAPGCGKTSLGLQFLVHGARNNDPGLFISFEEFPASIHRDAESLGWNLAELEEAGQLHLMFTTPQILLDSLASPQSALSRLMLDGGIQRVVLDSITHFSRLTDDPVKLRAIYNTVVNGLKREGVTTLLLGEESRAPDPRQERGKLSYRGGRHHHAALCRSGKRHAARHRRAQDARQRPRQRNPPRRDSQRRHGGHRRL